MEKKVVLITGASSGMGAASAKLFLANGWTVYAGARRIERMAEIEKLGAHIMSLDVTNTSSNQRFVKTALKEQGRIDVLINNAGYGEYGPAETVSLANARAQFDVNFFGAVELAQLVLPTMRKHHNGRILNISSIGGDLYMPLGAYYHATKAALQQFSDTLDTEVREFGIRSIVIQPGGTKSEWASITMDNVVKNIGNEHAYDPLINGVKKVFTSLESNVTSEDLAKDFYKAAVQQKPKRRYWHSTGDRLIVWAARSLPNLYRFGINLALNRMKK